MKKSKRSSALLNLLLKIDKFEHRHWVISMGVILLIAFSYSLLPTRYVTRRPLMASYHQSAIATKLNMEEDARVISASFPLYPLKGNLLIAVVGANGDVKSFTAPDGFFTAIDQKGHVSQAIFYKISDGTENTITASIEKNPGSLGLQIYEYSGVDTLDQVNWDEGLGGQNLNSGTILTPGNNELVLAYFTSSNSTSIEDSSWDDAVDEGFSERNDFSALGNSGQAGSFSGGENLINIPGNQSVTVSAENPGSWRGQIISFLSAKSPVIVNVNSSLADGSYGVGKSIPISVTFDQPVNVIGQPKLSLDLHSANNQAVYLEGSGSDTLIFKYIVRPGHTSSDLNYRDKNSISLHGGSIKSLVGRTANLILPAPSKPGALGANKSLVIDTTPPALEQLEKLAIINNSTPVFTFYSSEPGLLSSENCQIKAGKVDSGKNQVTISTLPDGTYENCMIGVTDAAGNISQIALAPFTIDTIKPKLKKVDGFQLSPGSWNFTFNSTESGKLFYQNCSSQSDVAWEGDNTIVVNVNDGKSCQITLVDEAGNASDLFSLKI